MTMKTNNHEVIFAIVNSGYAEDVMNVAREQGARGPVAVGVLNAPAVSKFCAGPPQAQISPVRRRLPGNSVNMIISGPASKIKGRGPSPEGFRRCPGVL